MEKKLLVPKGQNFTFFLSNNGNEINQAKNILLEKNLLEHLITHCDDCYIDNDGYVFVWYTNEAHCRRKEIKISLDCSKEWTPVLLINIPDVQFTCSVNDSSNTLYISAA